MCACKAPLENLAFCSQCGALNPVSLISPFYAFGLSESFNIDLSHLHHIYLKLQTKLHPDRFSHNLEAKKLAQQYSAYLNEAYQALKDPLKRARILLKDLPPISLSPQELREQMEKREYLNSISSETDLAIFLDEITQQITRIEKKMSDFFAEKEIEKAHHTLVSLTYLYRLKAETLSRQERL